jgi:ATP-dependent exoDNAse (exonuclease V) beta subunit
MANALEASREEVQLLRISEFNDLISALIQDENAPFIYERLGNRYHHFLLDEFQDTSHLQWLNLIPLIHDSLSNNRKNLIVGDPKQSIYRFKNGIAEQFVALPAIYNPKKDPEIQSASNYFQSMGTLETLHNNWRSSPSIVTFNTRFFETFRDFLPETTADFYNAVSQEPKSKRNGAIHIESLETKDPDDGIIQQLIDWIEDCLDNGYDPSDLCILGRRNRECNAWAIALDQAGYKVVSADSLLIDTSAEVRLAIRYLQWRAKPSGESEKKQFAELYFRLKGERYETYRSFLRDRESQNGRRYREFDDTMFIQTHFGSREAFFFKYEHLYDLLQGFFQLSGLQELQNPYLHHLADWAHEFGLKKGPNLNLFLEEYERKKNKIAVQIPAAKDAINIMTIHKSKGLEFPVVMLPSLNISLQSKSEFLIDYNDFLLYKKPSKEDVLGPLISLYTEEKDQVLTDIVNLTYVAMTRPIDRLFIRNHFEKNTFGKLFHQVLDTTGLAESQDDMLTVSISAGTPTPRSEKNFGKLFYPKDIHDHLWFPEIAFQDSEELRDSRYLSDEVQMGISFHLMASRIYHKSEINSVVQSAISSGELLHSHADFIRDALNNLWESPDFLSIVSETDTHITEQDILLKNGQLLRVDALFLGANATVIVDYKTGVPSPKDSKQLQTYTRALSDMGYPNVNGYAYYTSTNELRLLG